MHPYPDIVVVCCDKEYHLHRIVLNTIPYFQPIMDPNSDWYQSNIVVDFNQQAWELLVKIMYKPLEMYQGKDVNIRKSLGRGIKVLLELACLCDMLNIHWFDSQLSNAIYKNLYKNRRIIKEYLLVPLINRTVATLTLDTEALINITNFPMITLDVAKVLINNQRKYEKILRKIERSSSGVAYIDSVAAVIKNRSMCHLETVWDDMDKNCKDEIIRSFDPYIGPSDQQIKDSSFIVNYKLNNNLYIHPYYLKEYSHEALIEPALLDPDTPTLHILGYIKDNIVWEEDGLEVPKGILHVNHSIENYKVLHERLMKTHRNTKYIRILDKLISKCHDQSGK